MATTKNSGNSEVTQPIVLLHNGATRASTVRMGQFEFRETLGRFQKKMDVFVYVSWSQTFKQEGL